MAKQGLLNMLGLGPSSVPQVDPYSGDVMPVHPGNVINEAGATTAGMDNWQPRRPKFLGLLADAYLKSRGMEPAYAPNLEERNLNEALSGFASDPMKAIERLARIRGHEQDAFKLYNMYEDNKRADSQVDSLNDSRSEKYLTRIGGMLRAVQKAKDPATAYNQMKPVIQRYAQSRGVDVSDLPDAYDPDAIDSYVMGAVSPEDQIRQEALDAYREEQLAIRKERLQQTGAATESLIQHRNTQDTLAGKRETRLQNKSPAAKPVKEQLIHTKYGVGKMFNYGKNLSIKLPDGRYAIYENKGPNQWHLAGYQEPSKPEE